jgi:hypothetical protein
MRRPLKHLTILALLSVLIAAVSTEIVLYSRNALSVHPEWVLGKRLLAAPIMGARRALRDRQLVYANRLNLQEWHGFHEVLLDEVFQLGSLSFSFFVGEGSYLIVEFNRDAERLSGIRLSRSVRFPSVFFQATPEGKFLEKVAMGDLSIAGGWHRAELAFDSNTLRVSIDDRLLGRFPEPPLENQVIGFKAGHGDAIVDDVIAQALDGRHLIDEDFRNDQGYWQHLASFFLVVFALAVAIYLLCLWRRVDDKRVLFSILTAQLAVVVVLATYFSVDYYFWSRQYFYKNMLRTDWTVGLEQVQAMEGLRKLIFAAFPLSAPGTSASESVDSKRLVNFLKFNPRTTIRQIYLKVIRGTAEQQRIDILVDDRQSIDWPSNHSILRFESWCSEPPKPGARARSRNSIA